LAGYIAVDIGRRGGNAARAVVSVADSSIVITTTAARFVAIKWNRRSGSAADTISLWSDM